MQFLRRLFARLVARRSHRRASRAAIIPLIVSEPQLTLHRDVSRNGVRFFSLCGSCGARLDASATLCDECAQRRSRSAPPPLT
jgi:hypothetical protein